VSLKHTDTKSLAWLLGTTLDELVEMSDWFSRSKTGDLVVKTDTVVELQKAHIT